MSDEIRPALTPEEWTDDCPAVVLDSDHLTGPAVMMYFRLDEDGTMHLGNRDGDGAFEADALPPTRHALAALALHGQPFGFTWEMVDALEAVLIGHNCFIGDRCVGDEVEEEMSNARTAEAALRRIAALLPPREP